MLVVVRRVANGWVVRGLGEDAVTTAFEAAETEHGDVEAFARMLRDLIERFGMVGTKHDAARVRVVVEPGHGHHGGEA